MIFGSVVHRSTSHVACAAKSLIIMFFIEPVMPLGKLQQEQQVVSTVVEDSSCCARLVQAWHMYGDVLCVGAQKTT